MFRARLAAIFSTSHKMPRLPRNLHLATMRFARTRNKTRLKYCAYHAKWRWTRPKCCACHENCNASSENVAKVLCLPHTATFDTLTKHVWMSQSATPATWNEATRHVKPPKVTPFTELTIGTPIATSHGWLRTVANGCERLGTVANGCERLRSVERTHPQPPPPEWNGNPWYAFGEEHLLLRIRFLQFWLHRTLKLLPRLMRPVRTGDRPLGPLWAWVYMALR